MTTSSLNHDKDYISFLNNTKQQLKSSQIRTALEINRELLNFYWLLGCDLVEKQKQFKNNSNALEQFSRDIRKAFPEMQIGLSVNNLESMKKFYLEYPDFLNSESPILCLPWSQILVLLHQVKNKAQRDWYVKKIVENGWSKSDLEMQIEHDLFSKHTN